MVHGPKEKKERSLGERLHVKANRCDSPKCALVRRPFPPGVHGSSRRRQLSDFGKQLREKQKCKASYGLNERTLRHIFEEADISREGTSAKLVEFLERRLDNVLYRLGIAESRAAARKYIVDGHIVVNGARVYSPGFRVSIGDAIAVRNSSRAPGIFENLKKRLSERVLPPWLSCDVQLLEGKVVSSPTLDEMPFETSLVVESFSK